MIISNRVHVPVRAFVTFVLIGALAGGCATKPENIAPAYVTHLGYTPWDCQQLAQEQTRLVSALSTTSDAQRQARSNDIAGIILIGLPVSSLSGTDQASNIARLKGELDALQKAMIHNHCDQRLVRASEIIKKDTPTGEGRENNGFLTP